MYRVILGHKAVSCVVFVICGVLIWLWAAGTTLENHKSVTGSEISIAVLRVAADQSNGLATFDLLRKEAPKYLNLSPQDREKSPTRPNEEMWEQRVRNIKSNSKSAGNIIIEGYVIHKLGVGYEITDSGRGYLKSMGY